MLNDFITQNRAELIARCIRKAARRSDIPAINAKADEGIPLFLTQLVDELRVQHSHPAKEPVQPAPAPTEIGQSAALHGAGLMRQGYSIDQVVHDYGDVCQSVTELAIERKHDIATDDFRVMNLCLDNAIADAVTAYGKGTQVEINAGAEALGERLNSFSDEQRGLLDTAIESFLALQTGKLGLTGSTAKAHLHTLHALRALANASLSAVRLNLAKSTLGPPRKSA